MLKLQKWLSDKSPWAEYSGYFEPHFGSFKHK